MTQSVPNTCHSICVQYHTTVCLMQCQSPCSIPCHCNWFCYVQYYATFSVFNNMSQYHLLNTTSQYLCPIICHSLCLMQCQSLFNIMSQSVPKAMPVSIQYYVTVCASGNASHCSILCHSLCLRQCQSLFNTMSQSVPNAMPQSSLCPIQYHICSMLHVYLEASVSNT